MTRLSVEIPRWSELNALLSAHPKVSSVVEVDVASFGLRWDQGPWRREIKVGDPACSLKGLVEVLDNNPLVCADMFSVPGPVATLGLIALAPLISSGLLVESPTVLTNLRAEDTDVAPFLEDLGWHDGITIHSEDVELAGVGAATALCVVRTPERLEDIDDLYEEAYGRAFFVHRDEESEWDVNHVAGGPNAIFRLRINADEPHSLLRIQVLADKEGKCGAAQVVHAFNIMAGFEESLGTSLRT